MNNIDYEELNDEDNLTFKELWEVLFLWGDIYVLVNKL